MATIVTRSGKGSPLTNNEVDANFTNLNSDKVETSTISTFGASLIDDADAAAASLSAFSFPSKIWFVTSPV